MGLEDRAHHRTLLHKSASPLDHTLVLWQPLISEVYELALDNVAVTVIRFLSASGSCSVSSSGLANCGDLRLLPSETSRDRNALHWRLGS